MAEITPLRFKKDTSWEGENELPEYYTDADKRAGLLDLMSKINAEGKYIFDSKTWEDHRKEYTELLAAYRKAEDDYSKWKSEQEAKGIKATQYLQDDKASEFRVAINERETELNSRFSEEKQRILNSNNPEVSLNLLQVYGEVEKDLAAHPELKEKFADLERIVDNMLEGDKDSGKDKSNLNLQYKDGQLLLRVDNLGGSGLKFAIKDDLSIVFTENQTLTKEQVQEFAKFFDDMGMSIDNFSPTDKLKVVEDNEESKEVGSFENVFKSYSRAAWKNMELEELRRIQKENEDNGISNPALDDIIAQKTAEEEYAGQDYDANGQTGQTDEIGGADTPSHEGNPFADYLKEKDKDISLRKMKEKIFARAGIMRINRRCISTRRMPDGSMVISFYGSEQDKMNDGKLDKDGIAKHTKKCAFRMWNTRPPRIGIYVPQGAKFETAYAKGALSALKGCGYNYFFMPSAAEFGGDAQKAFWEAAGDQLMCPLLKSKDNPNGCDIGNDHLQVILKAIKDKGADDEVDVLTYKMRLIGQLQAYKEYKESKGEKFSNEIDNTMQALEGDVRFHFFQGSVLPGLYRKITDNTSGSGDKKWNHVDVACAYSAIKAIAEGVEKGELSYINENGEVVKHRYNYLDNAANQAFIDKMFEAKMREARPEVVRTFKARLKPGSAIPNEEEGEDFNFDYETKSDGKKLEARDYKQAGDETVKAYQDALQQTYTNLQGRYGSEKTKFEIKRPQSISPVEKSRAREILDTPTRRTSPTPTRGGYTGR